MTIKKRSVGFHAPVTLIVDVGQYAADMGGVIEKRNEGSPAEPFAVPGNSAAHLAALKAEAASLAPLAARITQLEAELSKAYADHDAGTGTLWNDFTEARDYASEYGAKHKLPDLQSVADAYLYHAGPAKKVAPVVVTPEIKKP